MKKFYILLYALFALAFVGCNGVEGRTLASFSEEFAIYMNEVAQLPVEIAGYEEDELEYIVSDPAVLELEDLNIRPLSVGATDVTVRVKKKPKIATTVRIYVLREFVATPKVRTQYPIMKVGQTAKLLFANMVPVGAPIECFEWENSNDSVAVIEDGLMVRALKAGTTTITATLKYDPNVSGSFELVVTEGAAYRGDNIPVVFLRTENDQATLPAGEELQLFADLDEDELDNYYWKSTNCAVACVGENGNLMGCSPGIAKIYLYSKINKKIYGLVFVEVTGRPDNVDYVGRLIAAAEKELGTREAGNGYTKYGFWYGTYYGDYFTNLAWCAMFVSWCANEAGISSTIIPPYANVETGKSNFLNKKIYHFREDYVPKAGDLIFFLRDGASHTGIVTGCDGTKVYTIEGNTSNMVARRSYDLNYRTIDGYASPNYPPYTPDGE